MAKRHGFSMLPADQEPVPMNKRKPGYGASAFGFGSAVLRPNVAMPMQDVHEIGSVSSGLEETVTARRACSWTAGCPVQRLDVFTGLEDLHHWRAREVATTPVGVFAKLDCSAVSSLMRETLVQWMAEVSQEFNLMSETFLLAVNYLDRYLCQKPIAKRSFQLLGLTSLWVAAKYEEVYPPAAGELTEMADNIYNVNEVIAMERELLSTLSFDLSSPTPIKFLHHLAATTQLTQVNVVRLAECLIELSVMCRGCADAPASHVATAAMCGALVMSGDAQALPGLMSVAPWCDVPTLSIMAQGLYERFQFLSRPGAPACHIMGRYVARTKRSAAAAAAMSALHAHAAAMASTAAVPRPAPMVMQSAQPVPHMASAPYQAMYAPAVYA